MSQATWKATITKLEKRAAALQETVQDSSRTHDYLSCRESFSNAWCQGLTVMDHLSAGAPATRKALGSCYPQLAMLQRQEEQLMQQLQEPAQTGHHSAPETGLSPDQAAYDADLRTISPLSDPLLYFRQLGVQPRVPDAASMTAVDLSDLYKSVVMDMSMQLHLLHNGFEMPKNEAVLRIKAGWDR